MKTTSVINSFDEKETNKKTVTIFNQLNPPKAKKEINNGESTTVPGMSMSIAEMLEYQKLGKPISATKGTFLGDMIIKDPKSLDIEDVADLRRKVMEKRDRVRVITENYQKAKKINDQLIKEAELEKKLREKIASENKNGDD